MATHIEVEGIPVWSVAPLLKLLKELANKSGHETTEATCSLTVKLVESSQRRTDLEGLKDLLKQNDVDAFVEQYE